MEMAERQVVALECIARALEAIAAVQAPEPLVLKPEQQQDGTWKVAGWDGDPKFAHLEDKRFYSEAQAVTAIKAAING